MSHSLPIPTESDKKLAVDQTIIPAVYKVTFPLVAFEICFLALATVCLILMHLCRVVFFLLSTSYLLLANACLPSSGKLLIHDSMTRNKWCKEGDTSTFSHLQKLQ